MEFAEIAQAIDGELTDEKLKGLDLLLLATYPEAVVEHMTRLAPLLDKTTLDRMWVLRNYLSDMNPVEAMTDVKQRLERTKNNEEFLMSMNS